VDRVIDRAIKFYEQSPTGQYDEEAEMALRYCRLLIDNGFLDLLMSTTIENQTEILAECMTTKI
jgi:hypothetical protein